MFIYCHNNPISFSDPYGLCTYTAYQPWVSPNGRYDDCGEIDCKTSAKYVEGDYSEELAVLRGETDTYKGRKVHKIMPGDAGFSFGDIFLPQNADDTIYDVMHLRHEYGHTVQFDKLGGIAYAGLVVVPSVTFYMIDSLTDANIPYYSLPWEFEADRLGNVEGRKYNPAFFYSYMQYRNTVSWATGNKMNYPVGIVA